MNESFLRHKMSLKSVSTVTIGTYHVTGGAIPGEATANDSELDSICIVVKNSWD